MNVYVPVASAASPFTPPRRRPAAAPSALGRVLRIGLPLALLGAVALFHAFLHVRVVSAGFELGRLEAEQRRLVAERDHLRMEVATLRAPGRLERFARAQLQMAPPAPGTIVAGRAGVAAAGGIGRAGVEDRRPAPAEPLSARAIALRGTDRTSEVR
jgi:cell division protein FtsL